MDAGTGGNCGGGGANGGSGGAEHESPDDAGRCEGSTANHEGMDAEVCCVVTLVHAVWHQHLGSALPLL